MDFPTSTTMMPTSTKGVSGFWSLSSGGEFPDEPDVHKQGRLQDHAQWHHNSSGHNFLFILLTLLNSYSVLWINLLPTRCFALQKYGKLQSKWDSVQTAYNMLRKFQLFANKVPISILILTKISVCPFLVVISYFDKPTWSFQTFRTSFLARSSHWIKSYSRGAPFGEFRWTVSATGISTVTMQWFYSLVDTTTRIWGQVEHMSVG